MAKLTPTTLNEVIEEMFSPSFEHSFLNEDGELCVLQSQVEEWADTLEKILEKVQDLYG